MTGICPFMTLFIIAGTYWCSPWTFYIKETTIEYLLTQQGSLFENLASQTNMYLVVCSQLSTKIVIITDHRGMQADTPLVGRQQADPPSMQTAQVLTCSGNHCCSQYAGIPTGIHSFQDCFIIQLIFGTFKIDLYFKVHVVRRDSSNHVVTNKNLPECGKF